MKNKNIITLNGQESTEIPGLLIQELPPISKPLMRSQIEEIDGRAGDIVTPLGFSAYDKEISIGLYGQYDIDEIIAYFNSEGTVTFSNEPEKYYKYQILQQIDFERLVRFRTATVTFHVQPFKYSTQDKPKVFNASNQLLSIPNFTKTTNGVTVTVTNGEINVSGTASTTTEFYIPISALRLGSGSYTLSATASGTNASNVSLRMIGSAPSNPDSFGNNYVTLSNGTVTLQETRTTTKTYGYVWLYVAAGAALNFNLTVTVANDDPSNSITIINTGNIYAKPQLTLTGSGMVNVSLNGNQIFVVNLGESATSITIDSAAMEAYQGTTDTLMNRNVDGDYNNFKLNVGKNTITWSGSLSQIVINNYSRWL